MQIPRNQCSFLKHYCPEPPSLLDFWVGVKYLSIYKATLTAVVQCRPHTQPQMWGRVGQKEKLRPGKRCRDTQRASVSETDALPYPEPPDRPEGAAPLWAPMATSREAGPSAGSLLSTKGNEPRGTGSARSLAFQVQTSGLLASTSSLSPAFSKAVTLQFLGCRPLA